MRILLFILFSASLLFIQCKPKKNISSVPSSPTLAVTPAETTDLPKDEKIVTGKVSHQFRATGCSTVVIVYKANEENPITLIPRQKLPEQFDVDGMEINFNYHPLKMPNPSGCKKGFPADLLNIHKK